MDFIKELSMYKKITFFAGCVAVVGLVLPLATVSFLGYSQSVLALRSFWIWVSVALINIPNIAMITKIEQLSIKPVKLGAPALALLIVFLVNLDIKNAGMGLIRSGIGFYVILLAAVAVLGSVLMSEKEEA